MVEPYVPWVVSDTKDHITCGIGVFIICLYSTFEFILLRGRQCVSSTSLTVDPINNITSINYI